MSVKSVSLSYKDGGSDKVYNAAILEKDSGFVVNFSYGRRGNSLTDGTKTSAPVDLPSAQKIFDKLVKEKVSKGYISDDLLESVSNVAAEIGEKVKSGMTPQLLNVIEEEEVDRYINDDRYFAQEKHDGRRMLIRLAKNVLTIANKLGFSIPVPPIFESFKDKDFEFEIDGEFMGDKIILFDTLAFNGYSTKEQPAVERAFMTKQFSELLENVVVTRTAIDSKQKRHLYDQLKAENKEELYSS